LLEFSCDWTVPALDLYLRMFGLSPYVCTLHHRVGLIYQLDGIVCILDVCVRSIVGRFTL
jgi:hypothetical protein